LKDASWSFRSPLPAAKRQPGTGALKLAAGSLLVVWLIRQGGWDNIRACIAGASAAPFAAALALYLAGQSLCAWKWRVLAGGLGFEGSPRFFWVNYLGAMFPSLFLPTCVGGDVFRAVALARRGSGVDATVTVLADRGTGLLALIWIGAVACAALPSAQIPALKAGTFTACALLTAGFILPFFFRPRIPGRGAFGRVLKYWDQPRLLLVSLAASLVFQGLVGLIYILLGQALGLSVDPRFYFVLCPIVSLAAMLPISLNGLGIREAVLAALFPIAGVSIDRAVAFGLTWTAMVALAALAGGALLLLDSGRSGAGEETRAG
jgi:glycosyltransferase 2 family protein